jgi:hypothetical protein
MCEEKESWKGVLQLRVRLLFDSVYVIDVMLHFAYKDINGNVVELHIAIYVFIIYFICICQIYVPPKVFQIAFSDHDEVCILECLSFVVRLLNSLTQLFDLGSMRRAVTSIPPKLT